MRCSRVLGAVALSLVLAVSGACASKEHSAPAVGGDSPAENQKNAAPSSDEPGAKPAASGEDADGDIDEATGESSDPHTDEATGESAGGGGGDGSGGGPGTNKDAAASAANQGPPKDLRILPKNWSREQVNAHMKTFNRGLGVKCKFCHDTSDFAANDNKHKDIARDMIRMQQRMNREFFGGEQEVSCFTCHKGKKHPPK